MKITSKIKTSKRKDYLDKLKNIQPRYFFSACKLSGLLKLTNV